jgi:hypothetical protein
VAHRKASRPTPVRTEREPQDGDLGRIAILANSKRKSRQVLLRALRLNTAKASEPALIARLRAALEKLQTKDDGERA